MFRFAPFVLLVACTACPPLEERPAVGACVVWDGHSPGEQQVLRDYGVGFPEGWGPQIGSSDCSGGWSFGGPPPADAQWLTLALDDGRDVLLGLWAPDFEVEDVNRRTQLELDVRIDDDSATHVELSLGTGRTVFWAGRARGLKGLVDPSELYLEPGRPVCRRKADCGTVRGATIEVEVGRFRKEVRPHEGFTVTTSTSWTSQTHTFVHGGYDQVDEACDAEAFVAAAFWQD